MQFPMIMGGVVPVVNITGSSAGQLKLDRRPCSPTSTSARSPSGTTRRSRRQPRLKLPDKDITVVHRADGSGTTWIFTNYLTKVCAGLEDQGRQRQGRGLAGRRGRQGQRGRGRLRAAHRRAPSATSSTPTPAEQDGLRAAAEPGRPRSSAPPSRASRPPPPTPTGRTPRASTWC